MHIWVSGLLGADPAQWQATATRLVRKQG